MPPARPPGFKGRREKYSRVICLGCRERRIRCELPSDVEIPNPGELRTVETPCYRCKRLGLPCIIRQTILGRPGVDSHPTATVGSSRAWTSDIVSRIIIDLGQGALAPHEPAAGLDEARSINPSLDPHSILCPANILPPRKEALDRWAGNTLLVHKPQCTETVLILRAADTLRCECVEEEWFRHLGARIGHTEGLDLSIKAMVAACAYSRGVPKLTSGDCYQALARALKAVHGDIQESFGQSSDNILASTALLAPFEGVIRKNGIPTRIHVDGLGAILAARPETSSVTQLARDIVDFYACESSVMACIQDTVSPFECISPAYFANTIAGYNNSDQAQLKAIGKELFIRMPRLVRLVRLLRRQKTPQNEVLSGALRYLKVLLSLQDPQAEEGLVWSINVKRSVDSDACSPLCQSLEFASVQDYEALLYYWEGCLSLLRLELRLHDLVVWNAEQADCTDEPEIYHQPTFGPRTTEMFLLAKNILMCSEYAQTLRLRKQNRLFAHAMVVVWGAKRDLPELFSCAQSRQGKDLLSDQLLRRANEGLGAEPGLAEEDLDVAAEIFVGGPRKGRFAKLFGL